jgi:uncharacterized protein (DUF2141 family)
MRTLHLSVWTLFFGLLPPILAPAAPAAAPARHPGDITVTVSPVRNRNGRIICALFDTAESFEKRTPLARVSVQPQTPATTCVFRQVKPGIYAISAIHDENGDGRLDKTFLGRPTEGYGISNNHTYAMRGPRFEESTFSFPGIGTLAIAIRLRYP